MTIKDQAIFGSYVSGSITDIESKIGYHLRVVNQFFNWGDSVKSFLGSTGDRIPLATLEPWNYSLQQISSGSADSYLNSVMNDCKSYGKPVYLRPLHEFNGDWYPWSPTNGQEALYKQAWNHLTGILKQASNVRIIWCPNADTVNRADPAKCWPGQGVDIIGFDGYNWNGNSFESVFSNAYSKWANLGPQDVWICETACGENVGSAQKADWVNGMFNSSKFPKMKAVVWFSVNKEKDWRIDSSASVISAFKSSLSGSNVQPPSDGGVTPPTPDPTPTPTPPPSGTGSVNVAAVKLVSNSLKPGAQVSANVALTASGGDAAIQRAVITAREPGTTHAAGPYHDFTPEQGATTIKKGQSSTLQASFTLPANAKTGNWEVYATYEDSQGAYHDGPSTQLAVRTTDAPPAPADSQLKVGDKVRYNYPPSRYNGETGEVRSVHDEADPAYCNVRLDKSRTLKRLQKSRLVKM